ncbi:LVIVD repeat-containing protein [Sphaerimonospora mesophila]|uniref:LVIVD repeat-containing protein n=1 Tax=Sphaerimonospora mesophila TaxID=37483 RepID=UPI0006E25A3A
MRRVRPLAALAGLLLMVTACTTTEPQSPPPSARPSAQSPSASLGQDEIRHSANMRLVANVPLGPPFDGPEAWGTDLAFQGDYAFVGNFEGFTIHDIGDPAHPKVTARVKCPGGQNDVSVSGDLLFVSVDFPREDDTCESGAGSFGENPWEGVRIFDVSDKTHPRYVKSVRTHCGSHTHTMIPGKQADRLYLYTSSAGQPDATICPSPHQGISIIEVPVENPEAARVVAEPQLFESRRSGDDAGFSSSGCHDITAYPEKGLAAAACFGDGWLLDISDPVKPRVLQRVTDIANFSIWHAATFNDTGTKVVFSDELGGGMMATCGASDSPTKGADAIYDLTPDLRLELRGYFKIPRPQGKSENCVAHNGALIPVPGRDIMVQAWYMGGVSVWDFTDSRRPREIAFFERGPLGPKLSLGGSWSAYYYNGHIYSSDITKGLDILRLDDPLTDPAKSLRLTELNAQTQRSYGRA